jgi:cysteine desulfurase/selenocysteine lyase
LGRQKTAELLHAPSPEQVTFAQNATDALHIIADDLARSVPGPGDEIVPRVLDHHSNIIPWLQACEMTGARIRVAPITLEGDVKLDALERLLPDGKRVVSVSLVSYAPGTAVPVARTAEMARARSAGVVIDGAQAKPPLPVNVKEIGCNVYAGCRHKISGCSHKIYGPASVSILYGKREWLDRIPPMEGGSDNSRTDSFENWDAKPPPQKFVASTPPVGGIIAFGTAVEYLKGSARSGSRSTRTSSTDIWARGFPRSRACESWARRRRRFA